MRRRISVGRCGSDAIIEGYRSRGEDKKVDEMWGLWFK